MKTLVSVVSAIAVLAALSAPAFAECTSVIPYTTGDDSAVFGINGDSLSENESEYAGAPYLVTPDPTTASTTDTVRAKIQDNGNDQFGQACL